MADAVWLKSDEFLRAIKEYSDGLHKDFAYSINRQMRNAAIQVTKQKLVTVADKQDIDRLKTGNPIEAAKFANWLLRKLPKERVKVRTKSYTGKLGKNWNKKYRTRTRWIVRKHTKAQAIKVLRSVVKRRKAAVEFVRAYFVHLALAVEEKTPGIDKRAGRTKKAGFQIGYVPATSDNPSAYGTIQYTYRHTSRAKAAVDALLERAWSKGMSAAIADMRQYLEKKLAEKAAQHSAR